jgi:O-antigen/teichoic acid export membrane protein
MGLMALRTTTVGVKFVLTLFIAQYLSLADLGIYGIIASASALAPVILGFGISINLGREAARRGPAAITVPLLQYFLFLIPAYTVLCIGASLIWPHRFFWFALLAVLLFLDHIQTEMYSLMTMVRSAYAANVAYFIRFAGWSLAYFPLALVVPGLRNLTAVLVFWLGGCVIASLVVIYFTRDWGWRRAILALPSSKIQLPHRHGSMPLYVADVCNILFVYLDRYVVGLFLSPTLLGVYVLYWSITNALNNLITISVIQIQRGVLVKVAQTASRSFNGALRRVALSASAMAVGLGLLASLMMYVVVPHLHHPEADAYLPLIFVLCVALVLRTTYEVLGVAFYAYSRDDLFLYSSLAVLAVALALNLWLDPWMGIWGAGVALVLSYTFGAATIIIMIVRGFRREGQPAPAIGLQREFVERSG